MNPEPAEPSPATYRRRRRLALAAALALLAAGPFGGFLLLDLLFPFPEEALHRPPAVVVTDRHGAPLRFFLPADERWRLPGDGLAELPPELPRALVASEDRRFYRHPGVDPLAVLRAARSNLRGGRVVSGASTIPMQIARMAEPGPRTFAAKIRESFRALQLTAHHDKRELLEIYLNLTPYGGNVEGVGAAAWFYFGKEPERLSLGEIALLTALPRSPVRYDPTRSPQAARAARDRVLDQLAPPRGVPGDARWRPPASSRSPRAAAGRRSRPPTSREMVAGKLPRRGAGRAPPSTATCSRWPRRRWRGRIRELRGPGDRQRRRGGDRQPRPGRCGRWSARPASATRTSRGRSTAPSPAARRARRSSRSSTPWRSTQGRVVPRLLPAGHADRLRRLRGRRTTTSTTAGGSRCARR